jgi:hypothetical protein
VQIEGIGNSGYRIVAVSEWMVGDPELSQGETAKAANGGHLKPTTDGEVVI